MPPAATETAVRARAFGLDLEAGFPLEGLPERAGQAPGADPTRLELSDPDELSAGVEPDAPTLVESDEPGEVWRLERSAALGYVLTTDRYGTFAISEDGRRIRCAPPEAPGWQHCLRGQALPFAALLRGLETFHASAVALDGRALAFAGRSTAGKTSVAVNLMLRGAELLTDDVVALELGDGAPLAHPGASVISLRHAEAAALAGRALPLGEALEGDEEATRVLAPRCEQALPLAALYFLDRAGGDSVRIEPMEPDPRLLLAASFNFVVQSPERLRNQLEVCARIAAAVPVFRLTSGPGVTAAAVARAVEEHA
jgi:hypothetical protein